MRKLKSIHAHVDTTLECITGVVVVDRGGVVVVVVVNRGGDVRWISETNVVTMDKFYIFRKTHCFRVSISDTLNDRSSKEGYISNMYNLLKNEGSKQQLDGRTDVSKAGWRKS